MKIDDGIIYDDKAVREVFYTAKVRLEIVNEDFKEETKQGFCYRKGKKIEGLEYKKEMKKMETEIKVLAKLFRGEKCRQYRIEENEIEDDWELEP